MDGMPAPQSPAGQPLEHGGDPPRGTLVDLSTGINPHAYPVTLGIDALRPLPTQRQLSDLIAAARTAYGVDVRSRVVAAPGTQAILQWLPRLVATPKVGVLSPTYGEHAALWSSVAPTVAVSDIAALANAPVAVLVNPNNPTGGRFDAADLEAFAKQHADQHPTGLVVVDEAFADVDPAVSVAPMALPRTLVLRSFGKFYGLAGVRLGFAIGEPWLAERLLDALGPWAVSTPAITAATEALSDTAWRDAMRARLTGEAQHLDAALVDAGFQIVGGTSLFRLAHHHDAPLWHSRLAGQGIWTRCFSAHPTWLRFGLPGENMPLLKAALHGGR